VGLSCEFGNRQQLVLVLGSHAGRRSSSVGSANFAVHGEDNGGAYSHGHEAAWEASSDAQGWWWVGAWNEPAQQLTRFHAKLVTNALLASKTGPSPARHTSPSPA
jgi:type V secretory pathway adhesin AidA